MADKIIVIGSSNLDMIMELDHIPKPGETVGNASYSQAHGGKGANQAVAAARGGGNVAFISCVGKDSFGQSMQKGFKDDGIDTTYVFETERAPTGTALIFVEESGENAIGVAPGANGELSENHIDQAGDAIDNAGILLLQLEVPLSTVRYSIEKAHTKGVHVLLNPAPAQPLNDDLLSQVSTIVMNESETEVITGIRIENPEVAQMAGGLLMDKGIQNVVITLGAKGCYLFTKEDFQEIPAFQVEAGDTTAAGDVFCGNLAVGLVNNLGLTESVKFASAASALSVMKLGAQPSAPYKDEIESFINKAGS